jgi:hypothetical protein
MSDQRLNPPTFGIAGRYVRIIEHNYERAGQSLLESTYLTHQVSIEGLPDDLDGAWPTASELKRLLLTRAGRPVTTQDIEADVVTLLSTGLLAQAASLTMDEF